MEFAIRYCGVRPTNHYHVPFNLTDASMDFVKQRKVYTFPCPYTTFSCFFSNSRTLETTGGFEKLKLAVEYNGVIAQRTREMASIQK